MPAPTIARFCSLIEAADQTIGFFAENAERQSRFEHEQPGADN